MYDAAIHCVDRQIGSLLDVLDLSDTTVFVSSDHGEEFWEHGHYGHGGSVHSPRRVTLYEELVHVPLLVAGASTPDADEVDVPVSLYDLLPTLLDAAEVSETSDAPGESLYDVAANPKEYEDRYVVTQATSPIDPHSVRQQGGRLLGAIRHRDWKYIHSKKREELYDLGEDPNEQTDVSERHREQSRKYAEALGPVSNLEGVGSSSLSDVTKGKLQDLGYL